MKITVVELAIDGAKRYLVSTSIFDGDEATTADPTKAKNYGDDPHGLQEDLRNLVVPGDQIYARSGLRVDALPIVVEMEVQTVEVSRRVGRELAGVPAPVAPSRPKM